MSEVLVETVGAARIVTINRPSARNALTRSVLSRVRDEMHAASSDTAVRCVVLTGAGDHFCAGFDVVARNAPWILRAAIWLTAWSRVILFARQSRAGRIEQRQFQS